MGSRPFKERLYAEFAVLSKAVANPHRLELLDLLAQGERSVDELASEAAISVANTSAHLQVLRRARLVEAQKRGLNVVYRLGGPEVFELWRTLRDVASARLAEVDRLVESYLSDRAELEAIDKDELIRRLADESVVILDVRPELEYRQGHIAGARSLPIDDLERRLGDLPADREIVAYCRGPYCVYADEAVRLLLQHGRRARRLTEGFPEWRAAGYPIETAARAS
jgi:rhodanese-related sulfurtransferase/DNA-binding transcriptional ArsR family regulator